MDEEYYNKPTVELFNKWLDDWSKTLHLDKYSAHLGGAFCENYFFNKTIDTDDVDVLLELKPEANLDYHELKNILEQGLALGYKHKLKIDIYLVEDALKFTKTCIVLGRDSSDNVNTELFEERAFFATELIPGLYEVFEDSTSHREKHFSKNYAVISKELTLPNNGS